MIGPKSTQTRIVGITTDEMHPYTFFIGTPLLEIRCMDASCLLLSLLLLFVYFLALPSLLTSSICCFLYLLIKMGLWVIVILLWLLLIFAINESDTGITIYVLRVVCPSLLSMCVVSFWHSNPYNAPYTFCLGQSMCSILTIHLSCTTILMYLRRWGWTVDYTLVRTRMRMLKQRSQCFPRL